MSDQITFEDKVKSIVEIAGVSQKEAEAYLHMYGNNMEVREDDAGSYQWSHREQLERNNH